MVPGEELERRIRNMDERHSHGEKVDERRRILVKMCDSGYERGKRSEVVKSAVRKHHRELQEAKDNNTSIYRSRTKINNNK